MLTLVISLMLGSPFQQLPDTVKVKTDTLRKEVTVRDSVPSPKPVPDTLSRLESVPALSPSSMKMLFSGVEEEDEDVSEMDRAPLSHLSFKGIPIDGSAVRFIGLLEKEGFRKGSSGLVGTFAGVENVLIVPFEAAGNIWKIHVAFPPHGSWGEMREEYLKYKNWFGWKYVMSPTLSRERLSLRYKEGSGQEAWGFESGGSVYESLFDMMDGRIVLYVVYDKASSGMRLCIDYIDRINSTIKEERDMLDL